MSKPNNNNILQYAGLATQWLVTISLAVWLGYKTDYIWLAWKIPVLTILLPLLTIVLLLFKIIKDFNRPS
jgi:hypothetical protein